MDESSTRKHRISIGYRAVVVDLSPGGPEGAATHMANAEKFFSVMARLIEEQQASFSFLRMLTIFYPPSREFPKDPDPQWYGYSAGKWVDDYTFVAETIGMDERTWLDNAGDPHSSDMRVEERYHRVDHDTLELTVKIDDPKIYTEPWLARDKLRLKLLPPNTSTMEMICAPTEAEEYKKRMANPLSK
jgi:hypothetical protein